MHQYTTSTSADESLTAATPKTLLQLVAPATRKLALKEIHVGFNSTTTTDAPVLVELLRQTSAGTMTAATPAPDDSSDPAALASAARTATAEPTAGTVLRTWRISPVGGGLLIQFPLGDEPVVNVSERIGLRCTSAAGQSGVRAYIKHQE